MLRIDPLRHDPRYLDKEDNATVLRNALGFLVGMSDFSLAGAPVFSEDDHRVTFPVRIIRGGMHMQIGVEEIAESYFRLVALGSPCGAWFTLLMRPPYYQSHANVCVCFCSPSATMMAPFQHAGSTTFHALNCMVGMAPYVLVRRKHCM